MPSLSSAIFAYFGILLQVLYNVFLLGIVVTLYSSGVIFFFSPDSFAGVKQSDDWIDA